MIPEKLAESLAHLPFLLLTAEEGKKKVGFNVTRLIEMLVAIVIIVYVLSNRVSEVEKKVDLAIVKLETTMQAERSEVSELKKRTEECEDKVYNHVTRDAIRRRLSE